MIHRHLDYPADTPVEELGPAALDDLLDRGDLDDWAPLAREVRANPWGPVAETVLRLCEAHPMYGTSRLWPAYVATCRAAALGGGHASWFVAPRLQTLTQLRVGSGLSQAELGQRLGMNQSEVSRLERRGDLRLSTLRSFVAAIGGRLRLVVTAPGRSGQVELTVGGDTPSRRPGGNDGSP